jgi:hypothetical protein
MSIAQEGEKAKVNTCAVPRDAAAPDLIKNGEKTSTMR